MEITNVTDADLSDILRIERLGFNEAEAGTEAQYRDRIQKLRDTFLVGRIDGEIAGFVVGPAVEQPFVEDWMYEDTPTNLATGGNQIIFTIAIDPKFQGKGLGSQLLTAIEKLSRQHNRQSIALTSLERNVPFYEKNGYQNMGVAESDHADEVWYNLVKALS